VSIGEQGGRIVRPWLGVNMQRVTPDLAAGFGLARPAGLVVKDVFPRPRCQGGVAAQTTSSSHCATSRSTTRRACAFASPLAGRQHVAVKVVRAGKELVVDLVLAAPPEDPPRDHSVLDGRQPLSGAGVVNMSPAVADELGMVEWRGGIAVVEVKAGSYAGRFVRPGDLILAINGQDVKNVPTSRSVSQPAYRASASAREGMVSTVQFR